MNDRDCKMHEFTLHSATKYKDGTPMMSEPEKIYCETDSALIHGESNQLDSLEQRVEDYERRICNLEYLHEQLISKLCATDIKYLYEQLISKLCATDIHNNSDFCGNCTHVNKCRAEDGIYACELSGEIVDPDDSSCSMFEPPF